MTTDYESAWSEGDETAAPAAVTPSVATEAVAPVANAVKVAAAVERDQDAAEFSQAFHAPDPEDEPESLAEAFAAASEQGEDDFEFGGKTYSTKPNESGGAAA